MGISTCRCAILVVSDQIEYFQALDINLQLLKIAEFEFGYEWQNSGNLKIEGTLNGVNPDLQKFLETAAFAANVNIDAIANINCCFSPFYHK